MGLMPKDIKDKALRHIFDRKVFLRNLGYMLIMPVFMLLCLIFLILSGRKLDIVDILVFVFGGLFLAGPYLVRFYTDKGSDVFTVPGCVLYRERKLFSSLFGSVHYVIYCITSVKRMIPHERGFALIWGDIKAAYVLKDGKTIHSYKKCRRIEIPNCFTDMDVIWKTLEEIKKNPKS